MEQITGLTKSPAGIPFFLSCAFMLSVLLSACGQTVPVEPSISGEGGGDVTLGMFNSLTVFWTAPDTDDDGITPLTDLAGFRVFYGSSPATTPEGFDGFIYVLNSSSGAISCILDRLPDGTVYVAVTALDWFANESALSNVMNINL